MGDGDGGAESRSPGIGCRRTIRPPARAGRERLDAGAPLWRARRGAGVVGGQPRRHPAARAARQSFRARTRRDAHDESGTRATARRDGAHVRSGRRAEANRRGPGVALRRRRPGGAGLSRARFYHWPRPQGPEHAPIIRRRALSRALSHGAERRRGASMSRAATCENPVAQQTEIVDRCPACAGKESAASFVARDKLYGLPGEFPVVECTDCGLIYLSERPTPLTLAAYYPADYYAYKPPAAHSLFERTGGRAALWYGIKKSVLAHQYGYRHFGGSRFISSVTRLPLLGPLRRQATFALDVLLHPFVEGGSLLEIGCGSGMYLDLMRALGWRRVVGVDISAKAIAQAEQRLALEVYCGQLKDAGFADESFDAASLSHTLE